MKISHNLEVITGLKNSINDSTLNDVQILVGKEKKVFYASSFLLGSRSPIFKAMFFTSGLKEQQTKQLELKETNPNTFLSFLEYLTTGDIELNGHNIFDIIELSDKYRFEKLHLECQAYLKEGICINNCLGMLENGIRLNLDETVKESWKLIDEQTEKVLKNEENLSINKETLDMLLSRNDLTCKEIDLFRFLVKWGKKQLQEAPNSSFKDIIKPYLHHIRFPLMNFKELIREVRPLGVIDDSEYIQALEFNGDKEFFNQNNDLQFQARKGSVKQEIIEDFFLGGPNYLVSDENKSAMKNGMDGNWNATCITSQIVDKGIHRWSLKILRTQYSHIMIGIAPHNINQAELSNHTKCGWYLYSGGSGTLYSGPPHNYNNKVYSGSSVPVGSTIDVELDVPKGTIKFFINGVDKGIAYQGIPTTQPLRLVVLFYNRDSIQLLSHTQSLLLVSQ